MIDETRYYCALQHVPYRNLAVEAYLLETVQPGCCILYLWQNRHTVVIGKNQNSWKECRVQELEKDGGYLVRRLSGGGAVFHDLGNLNFTFLIREEDYDVARQLDVILRAVSMLGIKAEKSGRNDITVDGKKFSGNAFYSSGGHCYHHGTLLLNVDMANLGKYLNVSQAKLQSKGVESVRSRVTNLIDYCPDLTVGLMTEKLIAAFEEVYGCKPKEMDAAEFDEKRIDELTAKFSSWEWKYGKKIPFTFEAEKRFSWGSVHMQFQVNGGRVEQSAVYSDAMDGEFIAKIDFEGRRYTRDDLCGAVAALKAGATDAQNEMIGDICALINDQNI